jgi:1-deoxyxylulose-5-phosphate synthase
MTLGDVTALGAITYFELSRGYPAWTLAEEESRPRSSRRLRGINFFDTANREG